MPSNLTKTEALLYRYLQVNAGPPPLFVAAHNFCKAHTTLGITPAVGAQLTDQIWTIAERVDAAIRCYALDVARRIANVAGVLGKANLGFPTPTRTVLRGYPSRVRGSSHLHIANPFS